MVGSLRGAKDALCDNLEVIGEGSFRIVYRQDDVVYKVENDEGIEAHANDSEWYAVHSGNYDDLPDNVRIPEFSRYDINGIVVLSAPYIEGILMGSCYENWHAKSDDHSFCYPEDIAGYVMDSAYGNVIFDGETYWIVDV